MPRRPISASLHRRKHQAARNYHTTTSPPHPHATDPQEKRLLFRQQRRRTPAPAPSSEYLRPCLRSMPQSQEPPPPLHPPTHRSGGGVHALHGNSPATDRRTATSLNRKIPTSDYTRLCPRKEHNSV